MAAMLKDKNILTALVFILIGGAFAIGAADYGVGTTRRMGPGYFPVVLGMLLVVVGVLIAIKTFWRRRYEPISTLYLRPVVALIASILAFGALIDRLGLIAACMACMLASGLASSETRWKELILTALGMTAFSVIVFKQVLGLPFRLWIQ